MRGVLTRDFNLHYQLLTSTDGDHLPEDTMDVKGKERGILKLEPRPRVTNDTCRLELTPQGSCEHTPSSPQPSVDRLSVTWAGPSSMASSGVNLFHLPSETPVSSEVKFSPSAGDGSEDEDYSASLSAVLRQRRASVRRSRKGRARRPSSPFLPDESRPRRRSSVFTTSSGDTAISMEEGPAVVTQEQIFENIHLHKEVLGSVKQQPLGMRRKLKIVHQAKGYIKRHEGQLQERLAQSKSTRDIYARFNILVAAKLQQLKREAANTSNLLIPWELRIKEIESHFGSVVASYFTFLRWLFWVNLVIGFILLVFVIVPEYLTANPQQDGERKNIMEDERRNATNLLTLWEFEGVLKYSPIFYGYYSNVERPQYRMPLAYFLTGLVVYIYSFVAILRKMAENSRMSKLSEKEDECIFSWKLFTGWDFMIGNAETAHNRIASVILGFKEALLEEAEKKKDLRNWRIIALRVFVNICVVILLAVSAYAVVTVVTRSDDNPKVRNWLRENETTIVVTVISITFPVFFELLGFLEHYHPRKQLRLQLAKIMLLNLLNLYSLIFALFNKIHGMSEDLDSLKPTLYMNATTISNGTLNITESMTMRIPESCIEEVVSCGPCNIKLTFPIRDDVIITKVAVTSPLSIYESTTEDVKLYQESYPKKIAKRQSEEKTIVEENLEKYPETTEIETTTLSSILLGIKELEKLRSITRIRDLSETKDSTLDADDYEYTFYDSNNGTISITDSGTSQSYFTSSTDSTTSESYFTSKIDLGTSESYSTYDYSDNATEIYSSTSEIYTEMNNLSSSVETSGKYPFSSTETTDSDDTILSISQSSTKDVTDTKFSTDFPTSSGNSDVTASSFDTQETDSSYASEDYNLNYSKYDTSTDVALIDTTTDISLIDTMSEIAFRDTTTAEGLTDSSVTEEMTPNLSTVNIRDIVTVCPDITFNCTVKCGERNITQVFFMSNCTIVKRVCYVTRCVMDGNGNNMKKNKKNLTMIDFVYIDKNNIKMYNLTNRTKKKLLKLCWETMFGQELVKLTMMDLVFVLLGTLFLDFFRALFVRYMNRCWCWDLEKKFPEYGDFKIAENILHLINNQGMVWMGMFFSPGLVVLNVFKLMIMMYLRSWAVMTCNVPHEVVFRVSKSNNFYLALLLTMLFLCVLPVGYTIVCVKPSWHCGPFSEYDRIYYILTNNIYKILPESLNFAVEYIASPAIVIPLLVLLILIIYYLTSLTNSLREANNDLKIQLRRERTEERRKMFQLADTRRRAGSSAMDNTPFARWKKALPSLPLSKSIDSDDRKTIAGEESVEPSKTVKKKFPGGIFAKIVNMALDKKSDIEVVSEVDGASPHSFNMDDETDTDFHENLPKEVLKVKDITIVRNPEAKKKNSVEFKTNHDVKHRNTSDEKTLKVKLEKVDDRTEKKAIFEKQMQEGNNVNIPTVTNVFKSGAAKKTSSEDKNFSEKQTSESSTQSKQSDSIGSVIPVIMISLTESDEEVLDSTKGKSNKSKEMKHKEYVKRNKTNAGTDEKMQKNNSEIKSLRRQSSVDSIKEPKPSKEANSDGGHKYQYSL